eukprot:821103-Rhodomonas_salina.2
MGSADIAYICVCACVVVVWRAGRAAPRVARKPQGHRARQDRVPSFPRLRSQIFRTDWTLEMCVSGRLQRGALCFLMSFRSLPTPR